MRTFGSLGVLVRGVLHGGREAWRAQRPLTVRWTLSRRIGLGAGSRRMACRA